MSTSVGLLHTVPALAVRFDGMLATALPADTRRLHVADAWLLDTARREGITPEVRAAVAAHVAHLESSGAEAVLVTCSSIGEAAEAAGERAAVPVLRVDAPMAAEAVRIASAPGAGRRVGVLATLSSTLGPTGRLVERAADAAGCRLDVASEVVAGAAEAADAGDRERVDALVAEAIKYTAEDADVIVLAQASMAAAAELANVRTPVLSSPTGGVQALVDTLRGAH